MNIFNLLAPKEKKFFPMFERATSNIVETSKVLVEMVNTNSMEKRKELIKKIEELEHVGDNITHEIFNHLSSTFITPFDREDIHSLTSVTDDILDFIHGASKRIDLYKVVELPSEIKVLADLCLKGSTELDIAIKELKDFKNTAKINEACIRINSIENHADDIYNMYVAKLFDEEKDPIKIIKYKEIISALEVATDKCEDAADVIKSILVKHA
jgi:predicted phosphate transport protein (TIGR00153 family)